MNLDFLNLDLSAYDDRKNTKETTDAKHSRILHESNLYQPHTPSNLHHDLPSRLALLGLNSFTAGIHYRHYRHYRAASPHRLAAADNSGLSRLYLHFRLKLAAFRQPRSPRILQ